MKIRTHKDLDAFKIAFDVSMEIFRLSKGFPREEMYSLTDQIRRSSRSVSANLAEAFRKRKYPKSFVSKLSDSEAEAADPPADGWLDYAFECEYIEKAAYSQLYEKYDHVLGKLVNMAQHPEKWSY